MKNSKWSETVDSVGVQPKFIRTLLVVLSIVSFCTVLYNDQMIKLLSIPYSIILLYVSRLFPDLKE